MAKQLTIKKSVQVQSKRQEAPPILEQVSIFFRNSNYDVGFLSPGLYWMQFTNENETQTHKLLKE